MKKFLFLILIFSFLLVTQAYSFKASSTNYDFVGTLTEGSGMSSSPNYQANLNLGGINGMSSSPNYQAITLVDTTLLQSIVPQLTLTSPQNNTTLYKINIPLTFTISKAVTKISYKLGNQPDVTIPGNTTLKITKVGPYNVSVSATDSANNTGTSNLAFFSSCVGDIIRNGAIDIFDASKLAIAYGSNSSNSTGKWDPNADFDNDNKVTIFDASTLAINYGKTC